MQSLPLQMAGAIIHSLLKAPFYDSDKKRMDQIAQLNKELAKSEYRKTVIQASL